MKKLFIGAICAGVISGLASSVAYAKQGPVSIMSMHRFETHSDSTRQTKDALGFPTTESESFVYNMVALNRRLNDRVIANVMYLNKYSMDDGQTAFHSGAVSLVRTFDDPHWRANFGYSYTDNPERLNVQLSSASDRFNAGLRYDLNPLAKTGAKYNVKLTYSTDTNFSSGASMRVQPGLTFPLSDRWAGDLSYTYSYRLNDGSRVDTEAQQLNNQVEGNLTCKMNKKQKLTAGLLWIDNTATILSSTTGAPGNLEDNLIGRLSFFQTW